MIRGVEVDQRLRGKCDPAVIFVCRALAEDNSQLRLELREARELIEQSVRLLEMNQLVAEGTQKALNKHFGVSVDSEAID